MTTQTLLEEEHLTSLVPSYVFYIYLLQLLESIFLELTTVLRKVNVSYQFKSGKAERKQWLRFKCKFACAWGRTQAQDNSSPRLSVNLNSCLSQSELTGRRGALSLRQNDSPVLNRNYLVSSVLVDRRGAHQSHLHSHHLHHNAIREEYTDCCRR